MVERREASMPEDEPDESMEKNERAPTGYNLDVI